MSVDIQRITLRRLLDTQSTDLYSKLLVNHFSGNNLKVFNRIKSFYAAKTKLPNPEEFLLIKKSETLQDYIEQHVFHETSVIEEIPTELLVEELQNNYVKDKTITFVDKLIDDIDIVDKDTIAERWHQHSIDINASIPHSDELFDVAEISLFPNKDDFKIYSSGLSVDHDYHNGGFATQELVLLGGRRGSGKSIISLNLALHRYKQENTVAFFSIEMRYKEVYDRLMSMISEVPFLDIFKNELTNRQKVKIARAKTKLFYEYSEEAEHRLSLLEKDSDFDSYEQWLAKNKKLLKKHRLFIIDKQDLDLSRLDHFCNMFTTNYPDFTMAVVDYLNIVKSEDQKDWKTQMNIADNLKSIARKHDITVLSPYQIDASGEARFSKGILDSADRSFNFFPPEEGEDRSLEGAVKIHTTKVRNGRHMSFEINMDWPCVRIDPNTSKYITEKPHAAAKYGADNKEQGRDI